MKNNIKTIINRIRDIQDNSEYDVNTRSYVNTGIGGIIVAYTVALYYLTIGNSFLNGMVILVSGVALSLFLVIGLITLRIRLAAILSSSWISFILFPFVFFTGGGINSGAGIWFLLGFVYVTLILSGKERVVMFFVQVIIFSACYYVLLKNPLMANPVDISVICVDKLIAVTIAGPAIAVMFFFREFIQKKDQQISKEQRDEIERLIESQQNFFSSMNRKIRTPIGSITGLTEMILRSDNLPEEVYDNTKNIEAASDMLITIIEDIIDMNKMQVGDIKIENLEYDSAALFKDVMNMMEPRAREKGLEFVVDIASDFPISIFGDKIRMKQILVNILNNAVKYTNKGTIKFSANAEAVGGILVKATYKVEDTGIGIKPENINSLFADFSRMDLAVNRRIEGTGLGLSIVKGIVTAMGGQIDVESTYGEGSVFTITLPQNKNGKEVIGDINNYKIKERRKEKSSFFAKGGRILIVDDDRMSREVVKRLLLNTGALIDTCENGREALNLTAKNVYHVIFIDHIMPVMDGVETFHRIRTQENGKNHMTAVVALTANVGENLKEVYQNIGFAGYLSKPVNINRLEEYIINFMPAQILEFNATTERKIRKEVKSFKNKIPVKITTDSMAGVSPDDITRYGIGVLPYSISMPDGSVFLEGDELDVDSMKAAWNPDGIYTEVVNTEMAEAFFREQLTTAENIIHICIMKVDETKNYDKLCGVADKIGNVTVFESGTVSVGAGIMAVHAAKMAAEGYPMIEIINELIDLKNRIEFRSRVGEISFLANQGRFPRWLGKIFSLLKIHPLIKTEESKLKLYGFISEKSSMVDFVDKIIKEKNEMEEEIFIAHPDVRNHTDEISKIKSVVKKRCGFENVVVVQSSPIIVANSGMNSLAVAMVKRNE